MYSKHVYACASNGEVIGSGKKKKKTGYKESYSGYSPRILKQNMKDGYKSSYSLTDNIPSEAEVSSGTCTKRSVVG